MAEEQTVSREEVVAHGIQQVLAWHEGQIQAWHSRLETALADADWDFYSLAAVTHDPAQYQDAFADAVARMAYRRDVLASSAAAHSMTASLGTLKAAQAEWEDMVQEFTQAARDMEDRTISPSAMEDLEPAELREQIAAIQDRLDDNTPAEDWSSPGRYYGTFDDELQTRLLGQLYRLQARLDALEQPELQQDQHREEGMSY